LLSLVIYRASDADSCNLSSGLSRAIGLLEEALELIPEIKPTDYTNIWRRGPKLKLSLPETISASNEPVVIAVDSTGIKVTNRGEWMREKWKVHRGWIKVHLAVDVKTKEIVAIEVIDERASDVSLIAISGSFEVVEAGAGSTRSLTRQKMGYGNCLFSGEKNIRRACSRNQNGKYDDTLKRMKGAGRAINCRALKSYSTQQDDFILSENY